MLTAVSQFETERASRYLQMMCKHFSHKVEVHYDPFHGVAAMPYGRLEMHALGNVLVFEIRAEDHTLLERMKHVVEAHIVRFAFREKLMSLEWKRVSI
jgi:hypothetical protein